MKSFTNSNHTSKHLRGQLGPRLCVREEKSSLCQLSAGGAKRDVEKTSKCTRSNCIRTPHTNLDLHRAQLSQKVEKGATKMRQQGLPRCVGLSLLPLFCSIRGPALPLPTSTTTTTTTAIPGPPSASDATLANFLLSQKSSISASIPTSYVNSISPSEVICTSCPSR